MPTPLIPCDLLLRASRIVTQDARRRVFEDACLAVRDGRVLDVGPWEATASRHAAAEVRDLGAALMLPGLINVHAHASMTLFRGLADDIPLMDWLSRHIWPLEAKLSPELVRLGAQAACAEMLATGVTCFADGYFHERQVLAATREAGIRVVLGEGFFGFPSPMFPTARHCWDVVEGLREATRDDPFARIMLMPHATYTTTSESLRESMALAESLDCPWHIHCAESPAETASCLEMFGLRPVPYLDSLGCLRPRTILAHCVDLNEEEIALVAARGAKVAHCPSSNMKLANGAAPVQKFLDAGIVVGLGTDGAASNNSLNLFTEMRHAALLQKLLLLAPGALPAQAVLDMATRQGSACLGWPGIGSLEPGSRADLLVLDLSSPNLQPLHNPVSQAVYAAHGGEVRLVLVDGRVVYQDGRPLGIDLPLLRRELAGAVRWMREHRA